MQVLSDLDLAISKAYITSDGTWFMDVFHVTDQQGRKVTDEKTTEYIEKALGPEGTKAKSSLGRSVGVHSFGDHIAIELIDLPGLLSEIFAVLANQYCNVVAAEVWTHKTWVACVIYINADVSSRLPAMEEQLRLRNVLLGGDGLKGSRTSFSRGSTHVNRRLHQLMLADKGYEDDDEDDDGDDAVPLKCAIHQHKDGKILDSDEEKENVAKCLEAAILRRVSEVKKNSDHDTITVIIELLS
ncbi:hypothetical protein ZIOFF_054700 [Zingiber officinale]|uniref:ACT domain-containing protein ACR n=1 Tax=Zingiber officinale TaxID=94328 RepID=A0A8J5FGA8_ZINOF|nr:hypothetical protein ZIOFF_054700 [Zingiber officinale]